jgi:3-deoxy-7-phosphoheptulonate synthase
MNNQKRFSALESKVKLGNLEIGGETFSLIAGPCTIENYDDLLRIAIKLKEMGIKILRGGAYKMRSSLHDFQGLGGEGLEMIQAVCRETDMFSVSEVISPDHVELMSRFVDILQVGTRNMNNYPLLKKLGSVENPIILKRGFGNTIEEWLLAAEYIYCGGNKGIILCERGIRSFETYTRFTLDIAAIGAVKSLCNLPVIVDPSHSCGRRELIRSLSWAAIAAGADGLMLETHFDPDNTLCDSKQTINLQELETIIKPIDKLTKLWDKRSIE